MERVEEEKQGLGFVRTLFLCHRRYKKYPKAINPRKTTTPTPINTYAVTGSWLEGAGATYDQVKENSAGLNGLRSIFTVTFTSY